MTVTDDDISPDFTVTYIDSVPEKGNPVETDDLRCQECGTPLEYSGRGRKPRYCPEHRKSGSKSAASTGGRHNKSTLALIDRAVTELTHGYSAASGLLATFVDETSGKVMSERVDALAESWRPLLETNAKFREWFEKTEQGMAFLPPIIAHGDLIVAIMFAKRVEAAQRAMMQETETRGDV